MPEGSETRLDATEHAPEGAGETASAGGGTRRGLLIGAGLAGIAGLAAACGGSDDADGSSDAGGSGGSTGSGGQPSGGAAGGGTALASAADIPVGGGKIFKDAKVVVCQPTQGQFTAFSATCTHRGCPVGSVSNGLIKCDCHGSEFKITDGSVANPPAKEPLPEKKINVQGDKIMLA